jgi:hypothetical protein
MYEIFKHDITSNILFHRLEFILLLKTFIIFIFFYFLIDAFMYISLHPFKIKHFSNFNIYKNGINSNEMLNILTICKVRYISNSCYIVIYEYIKRNSVV